MRFQPQLPVPPPSPQPAWARAPLLALALAPILLLAAGGASLAGCAGPAAQGEELLAAGKVDAAVAHLEEACRQHPEDPLLHAALGKALRRAGRPGEAEAQLRTALTANPDLLLARQELLGLLLDQERLIPAVAAADELRRVAPADPAVAPARFSGLLLAAGRQALETRQLLPAISLLERLIALQPERRAELAPQLGRAHEAHAGLLAESGRLADAEQAIRKAIELLGEQPALLRTLGTLLLQARQEGEAARAFARQVELAEDQADAARQAAASLRKAKKPDLALRFLEQAVAAAGAQVRAQDLLTLGELHLELGQPLQAREALDRYVEVRGGAGEALLEAARIADRAGSGELARHFHGRAVQAAPGDFDRVRGLAELLVRQGRKDEALQAMAGYRAQAPAAEAHFEAAQWYRSQGELARSLEAYQQALAATPERTVIYLRLAELLAELRRPEERRQVLDRFVQRSPDKAVAHRKVAGIYGDSVEVAEALRHLDAALRLQPADATIQLERARIFEGAKQPEKEEEAWKAFLRLSAEPGAAAREVALRYQARGDMERAQRFIELGLQAGGEPGLRLSLLLLDLQLQRRLDDPDALQQSLDRLLAEPASEGEKQAVLQQAARTMDEAQAPQLKLKVLAALTRLRPDQAELQLQLGEAQLQLRVWAAAAAAFTRFEELSPDRLAALGQIARAYGRSQRMDLALEVMNRMVQLGQGDARTLLTVVELRLEQSGPGDEETMQLIERLLTQPPPADVDLLALGHRLEEWRLFAAAEKAYRYADQRQPLGKGDLQRLGRVLLQQRKVSEAKALLQRAEQELPPSALPRLWIEWGQVGSEVGLPDLAVELYGRVLELREGPLHQAFQLAMEALQQSGDRAALEALAARYALKASPPEEVHAAIARAWMLLGDDEQALRSWRRVLVYDPLAQEALQQTASILLRQGKAEEAGRFIERQIREAGDKADAWLGLARRYRRWGALKEAVRYYDQALQRGADPAAARLERGLALLSLGEREEGKASIEQALALVHGDKVEPALLEAGQHYVAVGWDEMAVETFRRGLALDRSNQRYYAILVELYLRSGQVELARRVVAEARANGMARLFSVALSFEEAGYHQQALVLYQQLIEQGVEGQVKPAFWRLGLDLVDRGRAEQLAPLAQRFLAALGDSFEGHWLVALLYSRAGLSDLALQHLLAAAEKGEAEKGWLLVADAALKAGRRATALEALLRHARGAVGRAAEAGEAIELVLQWGEDELAFALLERLRSGTLGPVHHLLALGRLHLRRGDLWGGASLLQQAVAASREGEETKTRRDVVEELLDHDLLAEAEALLLAGGRPPDKEGQLQLLRLRAEQGDAARLEQALEAYLATQPVDETQDRISAGAILRGRGSFARAVELLRRAMEIAPSGEERRLALYHLLASLHAQGLEQELAAEARRYVERSPAPVAATHEVANELAKLARWELALELIRQRRALARSDYHLLQDELEARLALGQEGEIDELVEDMVQHTFSSGADSRSRNEILGRVASKLAWTMRTGEAIRRFGQLLESAPAEFAPLEKMLAVAIDAGNDGVLAELTSRFFATAGPRPATWRWLARRLVEAGRGGLALPLARQLVSAAPSDLRGHLLLVAALLQAGETSAAQQATAAALQKADDPLRARVAVAALWLQGGHPLPDVDEEGEWLTGDVPAAWLQRAIALAEPVCAPGPAGHATGLLVRGLARLRLGETKRAAEDLDEYLRRGGGFSAGLLEPFPYEEREDIQPGKLVEMGQERLGDVAGSEARLLLLIDSWLAAGEDERAGALAERLAALSANPEQVLGRVLQRASLHGRVALGLKILDWLGQRFPGNVWEVTMLADLLEQSRDSAAAIAAYRKGIEREPHQPVYYNNLAYFFARAGKNLDEALQLVHKARLLGPQGEKYYLDTEGWVLYGLGRKEEALQRIRASTWLMDKGMDSSVAESLYHLGLVLRDLGRQEEATAVLRRAAAMDFRGKYGQMARQELEKGAAMVPVPGEAP